MNYFLLVLVALISMANMQFTLSPTELLNRVIRRGFGINPNDPRGVLVDDGTPDDDDEDEDDE